ncbi:MAG: hypothetical protein ACM3IH_11825, partial [Sphingobacteriales bacterium]
MPPVHFFASPGLASVHGCPDRLLVGHDLEKGQLAPSNAALVEKADKITGRSCRDASGGTADAGTWKRKK